jgi:hypothetical protein
MRWHEPLNDAFDDNLHRQRPKDRDNETRIARYQQHVERSSRKADYNGDRQREVAD